MPISITSRLPPSKDRKYLSNGRSYYLCEHVHGSVWKAAEVNGSSVASVLSTVTFRQV